MPIASDRAGVNAAPIASVGAENAPPAVTDFMQAFRSGFITVDDLVRRGASLPASVAGSRQDLQDQIQLRPLARQQQAGALSADIQLQPKRAENLAAAEDLKGRLITEQGRQLPTTEEIQADEGTRLKKAQLGNALASGDQNVRAKALANATQEDVLDAWTVAFGQEPPETIQAPGGGVEPKPIEQWVVETYGQEAMAGGNAQAVLNRPDVQQGYEAYAAEARSRPLTFFRGSPEYIKKLKDDVLKADLDIGVQKALVKAAPELLVAKAKAGGEAQKRLTDASTALSKQIQDNDVLKPFRLRLQAVQQIKDLTSKPNPSNQDDLGLIYATVRALDPVSAVREGEISLLQKGVGLPQQLVSQFNRLRGAPNAVLTPVIRQGFAGLAETQAKSAVTSALPEFKRFAGLAERQGVPPEEIFTAEEMTILKTGQTPLSQPATPPAGAPGAPQPSQFKVGARVTLSDGRVVTVKRVTPTGFTFEE